MSKRAPIQVIAFEDEVDLRSIIAQTPFLKSLAARHKMTNGDALVFANRAGTRFRLVLQVQKLLMVCVPQIDKTRNLSMFLEISEALASLAGVESRVRLDLEQLRKHTDARIKMEKPVRRSR